MGRVTRPPGIKGPDDEESSGPEEEPNPVVTEPNEDAIPPEETPDDVTEGTDTV